MSTRNIPGGKGGRCVELTSPPIRAECHEIWERKPPRTLWATPGLLRDSFIHTDEPGYNDIGLSDTSSVTSGILLYQLISHY